MEKDHVTLMREGPALARPDRSGSARQAKQMFFAAAFMSFGMSVYLFFSGDTDRGIFVGLWVPSILSAGSLLMTRPHHG